jgi:hypothetical protein
MTAVVDGNWKLLVKNVDNDRGMILEQRLADGEVFQYGYAFGRERQGAVTILTLPGGKKREFYFQHGVLVREKQRSPFLLQRLKPVIVLDLAAVRKTALIRNISRSRC